RGRRPHPLHQALQVPRVPARSRQADELEHGGVPARLNPRARPVDTRGCRARVAGIGTIGGGVATMARTPEKATTAGVGEELQALRRQVVELQRISSLGVLAGSVCHELNNALTPILNYAKLGLRNPDPDFRRRAFEKILEGAQRASVIAGGVL